MSEVPVVLFLLHQRVHSGHPHAHPIARIASPAAGALRRGRLTQRGRSVEVLVLPCVGVKSENRRFSSKD